MAIEPIEKKGGHLPAPLKKRQERFVPNGNIENLKITHAFLQERNEQEGTPASLGIDAVVVGGEYDGTPITDYLNVQESTKTPGELYISKNGKLLKTMENALTTKEWNALCDAMRDLPETREAWIGAMVDALENAENPVLRAVIVQSEPDNPANIRNKLSKDPKDIGPFISPEEDAKINEAREKLQGNGKSSKSKTSKKAAEEPELSKSDQELMEQAIG